MKLLNSFKEQVKTIGPLKYVWLTSFNLNIEFVEMYLLPVVLEIEETPKTLSDYENIQLALVEKDIDFRVFCDKRFMHAGQNKRTTIPIHGISPTRIDSFSKDSLFHSKVIYMEGINGKRVVGSGSANLTVSGWGRNQEVFQFYDITTLDQYASVKQFFKTLFENVGLESPLLNRRNFSNNNKAWSFIHSFQKKTFLDQFFNGCNTEQLLVWSPYLPLNLATYISNLREYVGISSLQVALVTDRLEGNKIRTQWSSELQKMLESQDVTFYENPTKFLDKIELCHSKVWILPDRIAIGSWNFTGPGSNILKSDDNNLSGNNIEAGFLIKTELNWEDEVGNVIKIDQSSCSSSELLKMEGLEIPKDLPFDIRVNFDWRNLNYVFSGEWNEGQIDGEYWIKVPGASDKIKLIWMPSENVLNMHPLNIPDQIELLSEHRFEVIKDNNVVYRGLITEEGLILRRSQAFVTLNDLLESFIFGTNSASERITFVSTPTEDFSSSLLETKNGIEEDTSLNTASSPDISYFRLFYASSQYAKKIEYVNTVAELNKLVFLLPGCLVELIDKAKGRLKEVEPTIFNWFLVQEVNTLCHLARVKQTDLGVSDDSLPQLRWDMLKVSLPVLPKSMDPYIMDPYIELINSECQYASK